MEGEGENFLYTPHISPAHSHHANNSHMLPVERLPRSLAARHHSLNDGSPMLLRTPGSLLAAAGKRGRGCGAHLAAEPSNVSLFSPAN